MLERCQALTLIGAKILLRTVQCFQNTFDRLDSGRSLEYDDAGLKSFLKGAIRVFRETGLLWRLNEKHWNMFWVMVYSEFDDCQHAVILWPKPVVQSYERSDVCQRYNDAMLNYGKCLIWQSLPSVWSRSQKWYITVPRNVVWMSFYVTCFWEPTQFSNMMHSVIRRSNIWDEFWTCWQWQSQRIY